MFPTVPSNKPSHGRMFWGKRLEGHSSMATLSLRQIAVAVWWR